MPESPAFVAEITTQIEMALQQQREASARGDASEEEVALGRVADLRELQARYEEPLTVQG